MNTKSHYNSWVIIYENDKIIGYTPTMNEAEEICKKNNDYFWEFAKNVEKNDSKLEILFNKLKLITIHN